MLYNLKRCYTATIGTGTLTIGAAILNDFSDIPDGTTVSYSIMQGSLSAGFDAEVGRGTYSAGTLARDTVLSSTSGGAKIALDGTAQVVVTALAEDFVSFSGGVAGQVAAWSSTDTITAGALIPPATNILTLTNAAASTLALNIGSGKALTLTAADNYTLTVPATLTVAGLGIANVFTQVQTMPTINIGSSFYNSNVANNLKMPAASWAQQTGTVSTGTGGYTVTGTGTLFLSEYKIGDEIGIDDLSGVSPAYWGVVTAIASNTSMTTDRFWSAEASSNHRRRNPLFEMRDSSNTALWLANTNGMAFGGANFQNTGGIVFGGTNTFLFSQYNYTTPNTTGTSNTRFYWDNTGGGNRGTWYSNSQNMQINAAAGTLRLTSYAGVEVLAQNNFQPFSVTGYTTQTLPVVLFIDNTAATNVVRNVLKLETQSTGTAANGLGAGLLFTVETATAGTIQNAGRVYTVTVDATNASRKYALVGTAFDTAEREGWRVEADGSTAKIGLYGVATVARATTAGTASTFAANTSGIVDDTATFDSYTIGQVVKALRDIGILT